MGAFFGELGFQVADAVADETPYLGQAKAAAEVVTGLNARGEDIGTSGQVFAGISMIPGTGLAKRAAEGLAAIGKGGFKLAKGAFEYGAGYFRKVDDIADAGKNAAKHIDMPATVVVPRTAVGKAESWGRPGTLADYFRRHGADFGARSADDYAQQALRFLQEFQARGLPTKIGPDGAIRVYDPATNSFGSFNANGTTRTFYKPNPA